MITWCRGTALAWMLRILPHGLRFTSLPAFDQNENSFALFFRQTGDDDQ
jgi:hypothetical protein